MFAVFAAVALALSPEDVPLPAADSWVVDAADVLSDAEEDAIDARIDTLNREVGVEVAVVTLPTTDRAPKVFATALFNRWGIGSAEADNGLLFLLVRDARRLEMEVGVGLEPVFPTDWSVRMQERSMVPRFKEGRFGDGLVAGLDAVADRMRAAPAGGEGAAPQTWGAETSAAGGEASGVPAGRRPAPRRRAKGDSPIRIIRDLGRSASALALGCSTGVAALIVAGVALVQRRWRRMCPQCRVHMIRLDDIAEDAYLDDGQIAEEQFLAADWEVRVCPRCQFSRTFDHAGPLAARRCPACGYRTTSRRSTTLQAATTDHGGLVEVTETCAHCDHTATWTRATPRRSSRASRGDSFSSFHDRHGSSGFGASRSSSRRSFGGGRSRGGGGGSSW